MSRPKHNPLGRGLGALLPSKPLEAPPPAGAATDPAVQASPPRELGPPRELAIEQLQPNPDQPRKHFDPDRLAELAESIRVQGILQPIVVTPHERVPGRPTTYVIVAGERRWRAAQKAGLQRVPVVLREVEEEDRLELALVENIQRADLNPIEEARAYAQLVTLRAYTQEQLAERVGKDRSTVANAMRLLRLPPRVQDLVTEGRISMGHARALLGLEHEDDMHAIAAEILEHKLSVRATEQAVRKRTTGPGPEAPDPVPTDEEARRKIIVGELETRLRRRLGVRVKLRPKRGKSAGALEIPYANLDELDRVLQAILGE